MERDPKIGLGGARLVGRDDSWQPSARMFPTPALELVMISGLSARFPRSRVFGRLDRTWADQNAAAEVDWVPGAYSIIRREALEKVGYFDENFFLYYEEVDLCRRIKAAGYSIWYWPDVVVEHLGGESSKTVKLLSVSSSGRQLTLWRMRSELLFYRKHHPASAWIVKQQEILWHQLRAWRNRRRPGPDAEAKREDSLQTIALMRQAWADTQGGRISPERPW
jgi:GT2 family glycosyltransferase